MNHRGLVVIAVAALLTGCGNNRDAFVEASGTIEGTDVNVSAEVTARVSRMHVSEGSVVKPGDTLAVLDDADYRLQLAQARANAEAAEAQYRLSLEGSRREDVLQAEATLRAARADFDRMKTLLADRTVTRKQYDDAEARFVAADQTFRKLSSGLRPNEVAATRARRDQAQAQLDLAQKKLSDCIVLARTRGTVTLRGFEPGELVTMGARILRITQLDTVEVTIYVSETELGRVRLGADATVAIDAYPGRTFPGSVVFISPVAEFTPKNVQTREERSKLVFGVKLRMPNPDGSLKAGLPADARIPLADVTKG